MKKTQIVFRMTVLVVSFFFFLGLFVNCSRSKGDSTKMDISKRVEVVLYEIGSPPPRQAEYEENLNKMLLEKLNCTLKINWVSWADYMTKYSLLYSSGETFDMAYTSYWLKFADLAQRGAFMPLDELLPKYAPKYYSKLTKGQLEMATINGKLYAVPTTYNNTTEYGPVYRADLATPYGWDGKMENFADLEKYFRIVKEHNPSIVPLETYSQGPEIDYIYMNSLGLYSIYKFLYLVPDAKNPKLITWYESEQTPEFLNLMRKWNQEGFWSKSALSDNDSEQFTTGKAAAKLHMTDNWESEFQKHPDWDIRYSNFTKDLSFTPSIQDALGIPLTAKNAERGLMIYDLITSDRDAFRTFYYGILGKSYEIIAADGQEYVKALNTNDYAFSNLFAARTKEFFLPTFGSPPNLKEMRDAFDARVKEGVGQQKYVAIRESLNTESVETELAACINVHRQYWWPLALGYTDPVTGLAEYKAKMETAGIEKVRNAFQTQFEAYAKSHP